tara:strand:+ start:456 stop:1481 length:1026 start_codon:yes stop_codon:yes gene_type:complete
MGGKSEEGMQQPVQFGGQQSQSMTDQRLYEPQAQRDFKNSYDTGQLSPGKYRGMQPDSSPTGNMAQPESQMESSTNTSMQQQFANQMRQSPIQQQRGGWANPQTPPLQETGGPFMNNDRNRFRGRDTTPYTPRSTNESMGTPDNAGMPNGGWGTGPSVGSGTAVMGSPSNPFIDGPSTMGTPDNSGMPNGGWPRNRQVNKPAPFDPNDGIDPGLPSRPVNPNNPWTSTPTWSPPVNPDSPWTSTPSWSPPMATIPDDSGFFLEDRGPSWLDTFKNKPTMSGPSWEGPDIFPNTPETGGPFPLYTGGGKRPMYPTKPAPFDPVGSNSQTMGQIMQMINNGEM